MKKLFTFFVMVSFCSIVFTQSPEKMSYQAVIRNSSNELIKSSPIGLCVSILQGSPTGTEVFREIYNPNPQTNTNGLLTIDVGGGIPLTGTFAGIDWQNGTYFIKTEIDPTGGTNYTITGTSQILSVPYALHAKTAGDLKLPYAGVTSTSGISLQVTNSGDGGGIYGLATSATGVNVGVWGQTESSSGLAVFGVASSPSGTTYGVVGQSFSPSGYGVHGSALSTTGTNAGVVGSTASSSGLGVYGSASATSGETYGVVGTSESSAGRGVFGTAPSKTGITYGVLGSVASPDGFSGYFTGGKFYVNGEVNVNSNKITNLADPVSDKDAATKAYVDNAFKERSHYIGENYGGGTVFYVYDNGKHGLIAATADQSAGIRWYGGDFTNNRALADGVGAGLKNTAIIIANQGPVDGNAFAATVCNEYSVTVDGVTYGDWYLPSKFELNLLYMQKTRVGGFADSHYWSSTESNNNFTWGQNFYDGFQFNYFRNYINYVRAVRAF